LGLKDRKRMYNIKPSWSPSPSLYYFSTFPPLVTTPRYAFTFYTFISCAPMIFDDCLMPPLPRILSAVDVDLTQQISPTKFFIANSFAVHIFPFVISYLACPSHRPPFSSQPRLQFDLLSCSSILVSGTKPFLTRCYAALIHCVVLHRISLY